MKEHTSKQEHEGRAERSEQQQRRVFEAPEVRRHEELEALTHGGFGFGAS